MGGPPTRARVAPSPPPPPPSSGGEAATKAGGASDRGGTDRPEALARAAQRSANRAAPSAGREERRPAPQRRGETGSHPLGTQALEETWRGRSEEEDTRRAAPPPGAGAGGRPPDRSPLPNSFLSARTGWSPGSSRAGNNLAGSPAGCCYDTTHSGWASSTVVSALRPDRPAKTRTLKPLQSIAAVCTKGGLINTES